MDFEPLFSPLSDASPGGDDLVATGHLNELYALKIVGQRMPLPGDTPSGEKQREGGIDWNDVQQKALAALARSRDVRVLPYLVASTLRVDGLTACLRALEIPGRWFQHFPDAVCPRLVGDGTAQRNALADLADPWAILEPIRWKALTPEPADGAPSLLLLDQAQNRVPMKSGVPKPDEKRLRALIAAADRAPMVALAEASRVAADSIGALIMYFQNRASTAPAIGKLRDELTRLCAYLDPILRPAAAAEVPLADARPAPTASSPAEPIVSIAPIRTREDAVRALEGVIAYFNQHEPSSAVPLFAERARRLVGRTFVEIVADLAPAAVDAVKSVSGLKEAKDSGK